MDTKPLNEGATRGLIKEGVSKPTTESARPSSPPPAPQTQQPVQKK